MTLAQKIRVPVGFGYAFLYLCFSQPRIHSLLAGIVLATLGETLRIWASGHIVKGKELAISGPYQWTRNPLYLGSFLIGLGFSLTSTSAWLMLLFLILFCTIYIPVMWEEEKELTQAFCDRYRIYSSQVPLFFPFPGHRKHGTDSLDSDTPHSFQWQRVFLNREHKALTGVLIIMALTIVKLLWL